MRKLVVSLLTLLVAVAGGCSEKPPSAQETQPFAAAIETYLAANSMGMKAGRFKTLKITAGSAVAEVHLLAKDVDYGMQPLWTFTFEVADGLWKVTKADH